MTEGCFCDCKPVDFFVVHFPCALYPSTHPLIFQTCFKGFFLFSKACTNSGAVSYGNWDAFECNTSAGCSPSTILPLCSKEFPEHAAGEWDTLPAHCLILLFFFLCFPALYAVLQFSTQITLFLSKSIVFFSIILFAFHNFFMNIVIMHLSIGKII